jgi:nitrous oxidase accessory protein
MYDAFAHRAQALHAEICENLRVMPWMQIWERKALFIAAFALFLGLLVLVMIFRDRIAGKRKAVKALTYASLLVSFLFAGLFLKAQPTTSNIVIVLAGLSEGTVPLALVLMEPFIFLSFLFIGMTVLVWGRGVFCGWLCPYGAMVELLNRAAARLFPRFGWTLPTAVHDRLVYLKYVFLAMIVGAGFYNFMLSEYLAEVEPFKTFVLKMDRPWYFVLYFLVTVAGSVAVYRGYCRYVCPLGAALSLPSFLKGLPLVKMKRHALCGRCPVCKRECEYGAIRVDGTVNDRECLSCLACQSNFWDEGKCPGRRLERARKEVAGLSPARARTVKAGTFVFLLAAAGVSLLLPGSVSARTLTVGSRAEFPGINEALKRAKSGDVVLVSSGEYRERLKITKPIHVKGEGKPVLAGSGGVFIEITAPGVVVEGLTIRDESTASDVNSAGIYIAKGADHAVVRNNHIQNAMHAIWSVSARGVRIERNVIEGKKNLERNYRGNGIYLTDSQEAIVAENRMDFCRDGIYLEVTHDGKVIGNEITNSRYGIHTMWADRSDFSGNRASGNLVGIAVMYSKQSVVRGNIACGNQTHGLLINQTTRSRIEENTVIGNSKGVFFYNSVFNTLASNLIMNNSLGLHNTGGSMDNVVEKNSFISNEVQVKFIAGRNQQWDGNYWSDYLGWNTKGSGTGEVPYESNTVVDHIFWRYPAAKLLYASPSFQALWLLEKQFPLLKVPRVTDRKPSLLPLHGAWKEALLANPYKPERYFGDIDKIAIAH